MNPSAAGSLDPARPSRIVHSALDPAWGVKGVPGSFHQIPGALCAPSKKEVSYRITQSESHGSAPLQILERQSNYSPRRESDVHR